MGGVSLGKLGVQRLSAPKRCFHKKGDCGQGNEKKYYLCTENNPCKNEKAHNNDVLPLGGSIGVPVGSGEGLG